MKSNLKEIADAIPDFDDLLGLADEISNLSYQKLQLENLIRAKEAQVVAKVTTDSAYWMNGKPPSMGYIESTYKHTGLDGELIQEREKLAYVLSALDNKRIKLSIYRDMLEVFRTVSANERSVAI